MIKSMSKKQLVALNDELCKFKEKYPRVNAGGCAHVGIIMGALLTQRGFRVKYLILDDCQHKKGILKECKGFSLSQINSEYMVGVGHVMLELNGFVLDASGVFKTYKDSTYTRLFEVGYVTRTTLIGWNREPYVWNNTFRQSYNGRLKEMKKDLTNVFKCLDITEKSITFTS
jgi:hypothetical protein